MTVEIVMLETTDKTDADCRDISIRTGQKLIQLCNSPSDVQVWISDTTMIGISNDGQILIYDGVADKDVAVFNAKMFL